MRTTLGLPPLSRFSPTPIKRCETFQLLSRLSRMFHLHISFTGGEIRCRIALTVRFSQSRSAAGLEAASVKLNCRRVLCHATGRCFNDLQSDGCKLQSLVLAQLHRGGESRIERERCGNVSFQAESGINISIPPTPPSSITNTEKTRSESLKNCLRKSHEGEIYDGDAARFGTLM